MAGIFKAFQIEEESIVNDNKIEYVNGCDISDIACLNDDFVNNSIEIIRPVNSGELEEFTHIIKVKNEELYYVVAITEGDWKGKYFDEHKRK